MLKESLRSINLYTHRVIWGQRKMNIHRNGGTRELLRNNQNVSLLIFCLMLYPDKGSFNVGIGQGCQGKRDDRCQ